MGSVAEKMSNDMVSVMSQASGFSEAEIEATIDKIEDQVCEKVTDLLEKKFKKKARQLIKKAIKKVLKKILRKFLSKGLAKKVPVAGIAAGSVFALEKGMKNDWPAAGMEFASGTVSVIPVYGTGASCAIDMALLAHDVEVDVGDELN